MPKLTKRFLDDLKPEQARGDQTYWDDSLKGFGVRVRASGAMSWIIMYRNRDNRLRKYTIGQVGALTPDEARDEARQKLADAHRGLDPSADKGAQRKAMSARGIGRENLDAGFAEWVQISRAVSASSTILRSG